MSWEKDPELCLSMFVYVLREGGGGGGVEP